MNHILILTMIGGSIFGLSSRQVVDAPVPVALFISMPKDNLRAGIPAILVIDLTNKSANTITVPQANGPRQAAFNYVIKVSGRDGKFIPKIEEVKPNGFHVPKAWSNIGSPIPPNGVLREECDLAKEFHIENPGRYWVEVERSVPGGHGEVAHSNRLFFTITQQ